MLLDLIFFDICDYRGRRFYKYNENDFLSKFMIINKLFSSKKFTSNQREVFQLTASVHFYVCMYPCC